ncbi:MAG: ABC transporter permease, partial [Deltaproteobacteria bacterium]|nr:ABC transporter permease [Deltaproteobacteria bacterium]
MILNIIKIAFHAILANKMRSLLTMLGIIIGVGAIIAMLSLAEGARREVTESIRKMGTNLLRVRPGMAQVGHVASGAVETLKIEDALAIKETIPGIHRTSPAMANQGQIKYSAKNTATLITGTTPEFMDINNFIIEQGRFLEPIDARLMKKVAVLGATVKKDLFGDGIAIGEWIKVEGQSFLVIGVMEPKGQTSWRDPDDQIFVPVTTFGKRLFDQEHLNDIFIQV